MRGSFVPFGEMWVMPAETSYRWQPITEFDPPRDTKPSHLIQLPDGTIRNFSNCHWKDLFEGIMSWLVTKGHLRTTNCPIKRDSYRYRYIVHSEPIHENGYEFSEPRRISSLYFETKDNGDRLIENAIVVIESCVPELLGEFRFKRW